MTAPANKFGRWVREIVVSPTPSTVFYGTPALVKCGNGDLLASFDEFGSAGHTDGTDLDRSWLTRSTDGGDTWSTATATDGVFWSSFLPDKGDGNLYRLGTNRRYGSLVIVKSDDNGATWGSIATLRAEVASTSYYHRGPCPCLIHDGFLYVAAEVDNEKNYPIDSYFVGRVPTTSDWTDAGEWEWTATTASGGSEYWSGQWRCSEGNIVLDGSDLKGIWRLDHTSMGERSYFAEVIIDPDTFTLGTMTVRQANGGHTKFELHTDPDGEGHWFIHNPMPDGKFLDGDDYRTQLWLSHVSDLSEIDGTRDFLGLPLFERPDSEQLTQGFQYPCMIFDGADILGLVRVAWNGASSYHDSNRIQFFRVPNYRSLK